LKPAAARAKKLAGLFGDFDGNPMNDLVSRSGVPIASMPPTYDDLYHLLGDSWRVKPSESLFDYGPNESTATFTDLSFPDRIYRASDLPSDVAADAMAVCVAAGISDPELLDECVLDVGATGVRDFAAALKAEQIAFTPLPPPPPGTILIDGQQVRMTIP